MTLQQTTDNSRVIQTTTNIPLTDKIEQSSKKKQEKKTPLDPKTITCNERAQSSSPESWKLDEARSVGEITWRRLRVGVSKPPLPGRWTGESRRARRRSANRPTVDPPVKRR
ncbi:hypothetical protein K0M31_014038 [Melipona bicolor]|uniref:Uncharacterized protein n=1 Tax=Melipona bicolor TaxID=60889 RepID=A0AA40G7R8_9HYME|nr:hypothetical protein K0M31_014038 [Melipona bicolor]